MSFNLTMYQPHLQGGTQACKVQGLRQNCCCS